MMKIVIIGAGAMGCRFGAHFQNGGAEVALCDIWAEHVNAINQKGLKIIQKDGSFEIVKLPAFLDIASAGVADVIVLLTKSAQTESALKSAECIMTPDTVVLSVQNGLGNFDIIENIIGKDRMIIGSTLTATTLTGPGEIRVDSAARSAMQGLGPAAERMCKEVSDILEKGGMAVHVSENVLIDIWQKLSFNAAMNPITGITRLVVGNTGVIGEQTATMIAEEVANVAEAEGIQIDRSYALNLFHTATAPDGDKTHLTSMLQDVVRERKTEVDAICGSIIKRAEKHGIPVPHLETVYNLICIIESNYENQLSPDRPDVF